MLFKYVYNAAQDSDNQPDSLKRYCSAFDKEMKLGDLMETIDDVEATYLVPYIGEALYQEIQTAYNAYPTTAMDADMDALVRKIQAALAYFVLFQTITTRGLHMSTLGPGEAMSKEGTYVFPRQWRTKEALRKSFSVATTRMDRALAYLDGKINLAIFDTYKTSSVYADSKALFLNNAFELERYMPANSSRIVYLQLRSSIEEAERRYILPTLGQAFFDELKLAIKNAADTPLTAEQIAVIDKIRLALVQFARMRAIPNLRLRINDMGLVEPDFDMEADSRQVRPAREEIVRSLWINLQEAGQEFLVELRSFLNISADDYPTYKSSDRYVAPEDSDPFHDSFHEEGGGVVSFL